MVLKHFSSANAGGGWNPEAGLAVSGSVIYGTTYEGGSSNLGTVFKVNTDGTAYTVLKNFMLSEGYGLNANLTLSGSVLYGVTYYGGSSNLGTVFKVNTDGTDYTVLKHFAGTDGEKPLGGLVLSGGVLYGTTVSGGSSFDWTLVSDSGTVFKLNTDGTGFTVLKNFSGSDGDEPDASLILSGSVLYGTTGNGGSLDEGTLFKLDLSVPLTIKSSGNAVVLSWPGPAFALQADPAVSGTYTNIPGATSPYTNSVTGQQQFFRLKLK
jgi:uncharacterized repeat protein (TIGR03803 family)